MSQPQSAAPGAAGPAMPAGPERVNWAALIAIGVAVLMTTVDLLIVQTALPTIGRAFNIGPALSQWLVLSYAATAIALQMPAGRWIDAVSPRRAYLMSIIGFMISSVICAIAPSIWVLILGRVLQGAFSAVLGAVVPVLVVGAAPLAQRGRAMGIVGTLGPLGAVSGPVIGAFLLSVWDWRGIFLVNVPIGIVALVLAMRSIPAGGRMPLPGVGFLRETLAAAVTGLALFTALTLAARTHPSYFVVALAALVFVIGGVWWYREPGGHAVMRLLAVWPLSLLLIGSFGINIIGGALNYLPPFTLDQLIHLPVSRWGLVLLCMPLGLAVSSNIGGIITDKWGARSTAIVGSVVVLAGTTSLAVSPAWGGAVGFGLRLLLIGLGMGTYVIPVQTMFFTLAPPELRGTAGAAANLLRQLGFSVGPALGTLVWLTAGHGTGTGLSAAFLVPVAAAVMTLVVTIRLVMGATPTPARPGAPVGAPPAPAAVTAPQGQQQ